MISVSEKEDGVVLVTDHHYRWAPSLPEVVSHSPEHQESLALDLSIRLSQELLN